MSNELVLEEVIVKEQKLSTYLFAADDGHIYLNVPGNSYKLQDNEIIYIGSYAYIAAQVHEHTRKSILYPIGDGQIFDVNDYFRHWNSTELNQLSLNKWNSFLLFWNYTLDFIRENVDITNVTYKIYATDYRMYEGDLNIHFDIHLTDDYSDNHADYFRLNDLWFDGYYDIHTAENNEYYWFSNIHISFKP